MKEEKGTCKFCGQTKLVTVPDSYEEADIDEIVTQECKCDEARAYQEKLEAEELLETSKRTAEAMIIELFQEEFEPSAELLREAIEPLSRFMFEKLTIKLNNNVTAVLSINGKGEIKIERKEKKTYTRITSQ